MVYDLVVIGSGPGGHGAAEEAARLGAKVAVIEKEKWGGTCTNWGCIPTKALLACSKKYSEIKKLKRMGISVGNASFDFSAMKRHQQQMVRVSALGVQKSLKEAGVDLKEGEGALVSPEEIEITSSSGGTEILRARNIILAWGSKPAVLPGIESSDRVLNSRQLLALATLPRSIIVIGGGAIGVEFATFMAELGTKVTLVELMDQILPNEERGAADFLEKELKRLGIDVHTSTGLTSARKTEEGLILQVQREGKSCDLDADYALICVGRKPSLRTDELDRFSIRYSEKGIAVDDRLMTSIENIYAVGDATGGIMLAHRASAQGRALAHDLFGNGNGAHSDDAVPAVVFTHPNVARVGLTEAQARKRGTAVEVKKVEYGSNIIARTEIMGNGFAKFIFSDEKLSGVTIVGDSAAELIAPMGLAVVNHMTRDQLRSWVIPHPTLSELLTMW